ncbi:hypothetical protein ACLOJK_013529 [Asimina triloba]
MRKEGGGKEQQQWITAAMSLRSIFVALIQKRRSSGPAFLSYLSRSSSTGALNLDPVEESQPSCAHVDDLKGRILRLRFPKRSATAQLQRWIGEGKDVTLPQLRQIAKELRKLQRYKHALELKSRNDNFYEKQKFPASPIKHLLLILLLSRSLAKQALSNFGQFNNKSQPFMLLSATTKRIVNSAGYKKEHFGCLVVVMSLGSCVDGMSMLESNIIGAGDCSLRIASDSGQVSEWMVTQQEAEVSEHDYAVRIDLITKVFGTNAAEEFFQGLPPTAKTSETYTALLHSYASAKQTEKAETVFERIKESGFTLSVLAYNEIMTLYMSTGQIDKVASVVEELRRLRVSPDLFTYNLWISSCAAALDIDGLMRILDEMGHDSNLSDGWRTYITLAKIYITAGCLVNSKYSPGETEKTITQREWITYDFLIILHSGLGNKERIPEIWKSLRMTSQKMTSRNYFVVISSHVILGLLKEAAEVIDQWKQSGRDCDAITCKRLYDAFLEYGSVEQAESLYQLLLHKDSTLTDWSQ